MIRQGLAIGVSDDVVSVPLELLGPGEVLYVLGHDLPKMDLSGGDVLITEPRLTGQAATGELVIASVGDRTFIGRYWKKHGPVSIRDADASVVTAEEGISVRGAVTAVVRPDVSRILYADR